MNTDARANITVMIMIIKKFSEQLFGAGRLKDKVIALQEKGIFLKMLKI